MQKRHQLAVCAMAAAGAVVWGGIPAIAKRPTDGGRDDRARTVFVIAMENHNWTQPSTQSSPQPIFMNPAAPFINSLVSGSSGISSQVAYAVNYANAAVGNHPSEPNYIWAEAGQNFGVNNDDNPYNADCSAGTVQDTDQHLTAFLTRAGRGWQTYQEDTNVDAANVPLPASSWTVPLFSAAGVFTGGINPYNYTAQFNYASKHNPMVFFTDTAGGCDAGSSNPMRAHYAPLQQLATDLQNDTVADYNWITPNQFNDMHTALAAGYGGFPNGDDGARIAQGDNFLARVVPLIMSSKAYQNHGIIVLWWDESEGGDTPDRTVPFIVISRDVHPNVDGLPFAGAAEYSHSSTLRTMQEIFAVDPRTGFPWLGGAENASDLSDLFRPGTVR